jgi:vitamin B12/bleomycin/antimicrobial peptide transport system ATP-binding/permease protein
MARAQPPDLSFAGTIARRNSQQRERVDAERDGARHSMDARPDAGVRRALVQRYWRTARQFWSGKARIVAWALTGALVVVTCTQIFVQYRINVWNRDVFDALEKKDGAAVLTQAIVFVPLAIGGVVLAILAVYGRMRAQRRWRAWLTDHLVDRWLDKGRYYQLNFLTGDHQNPEGRIAEDARVATDAPIDFAVGLLSAFFLAATFVGVLWNVGGTLNISWGATQLAIPGYLVVAVVLYAAFSSTAMVFIARSFVPIAETKNQAEAEFRYALTRVRENGESIALLGGEKEERGSLRQSLRQVITRWNKLGGQYMRTTFVANANYMIAPVIPIILCAPKYLTGEMSLGQVMQAAAAFVQVQTSFNWLVDNYPRLADWAASAGRVAALLVALDRLEDAERRGIGAISRSEHDGAAIRLKDVSVTLSDGTVVVDDADVTIDLGERVLFVGESGTGKSTLVRAIAGLWPWGGGDISIQRGAKLFLMPQKPYIPLGTLRRAASYPMAPEEIGDETMRAVLQTAGLSHLTERLDDEDADWARTLSGGEQQRLAFVRLLLHKPDIVVMDEATSALDPQSQADLMAQVIEALPKMAIISVGHRPELEQFHQRKITLERHEGGAQLASDELLSPTTGLMSLLLTRWRRPQRPEPTLPAPESPA